MRKIRILIVDDQDLFSESLSIVLQGYGKDSLDILGISRNGKEACRFVRRNVPDIILMDIRMPEMDGVEATEIIHKEFPDVKIIILTTFDDDILVKDAIKRGAQGYILKDTQPEDLVSMIQVVNSGSMLIPPSIGSRLFDPGNCFGCKESKQLALNIRSQYPRISNRELDVLLLISEACENDEIAEKLCIAHQTVKNYISSIYSKLNVENRLQVIQKIRQLQG